MAVYGYARIRQFRELEDMGVPQENIYYDVASGTKTDRIEFKRLLQSVSRGDTIISTEPSRITRSIRHLIEIMDFVVEKGLKLVLGNFVVDCTNDKPDPMTIAVLQVMGIFSQLERDLLSARVKSGMINAREKGKQIGRKVVNSITDIPSNFIKYYSLYENGTINKSMLSELTGVSYPTTLKYVSILQNKNVNH